MFKLGSSIHSLILGAARSALQLAVGTDLWTEERPHEEHLGGVDFGCYSALARDGGRLDRLTTMVRAAV